MAERRMFAKTIVDSDAFLDMPLTTQSLYFHLSMRADDDGFINNPKKIQRMIGCSDDDLKLLTAKKFILTFESGVIVIKHWKIHNYIRKDRYNETLYQKEKNQLGEKENKGYSFLEACHSNVNEVGLPNDDQRLPQVRLGKVRLGKEDKSHKYSDEHLRLATKLRDNLQVDFPKEAKKVNLESWASDIRLLEEKDEEPIKSIEFVLDWLPKNNFWSSNIRSAKKLRQQFERLKKEIKNERQPKKFANEPNIIKPDQVVVPKEHRV